MKTIVWIFALSLSSFAYADYFGCDLKVGNSPRVGAEAEYRGREISVSFEDWSCEAKIDQNIQVSMQISNPKLGIQGQASNRASVEMELQTDDGIVSCKCGLR